MNNQLIMEMTRYYSGDPKHIQHFMKVYAYARMIGEMERLDRKTQHMLETAAIVHDIGIKESMEIWRQCWASSGAGRSCGGGEYDGAFGL